MTADGKLITGAGKAYDSGGEGRGFCVRFGFFFFMKAILSFFDFGIIFVSCFLILFSFLL